MDTQALLFQEEKFFIFLCTALWTFNIRHIPCFLHQTILHRLLMFIINHFGLYINIPKRFIYTQLIKIKLR